MDNRQTVTHFLTRAFNEKQPVEAAQLLGPTYVQHNPQASDGVAAFVAFIEGFTASFPKVTLDIKRTVADGDLVAVHSHLTLRPGDRGSAVMDIFRLENGRIVEHWDVLQEVPEHAANDNTMF